MVVVADIKNKQRRAEVRARERADKSKERKKRKIWRNSTPSSSERKQEPRSIDKMREFDPSFFAFKDEKDVEEKTIERVFDEFEPYLSGEKQPKIMVTTGPKPRRKIFPFIAEVMTMLPNTYFYKREKYALRDMCRWAGNKKFTHLMVIAEKNGKLTQMLICHTGLAPRPVVDGSEKASETDNDVQEVQIGPTALFKISNFRKTSQIKGHGRRSNHFPEILLNHFATPLGDRVGRFLSSLFVHKKKGDGKEDFIGRNVTTFHNQRDFIFVRSHRYIFEENFDKVRLQELGPRFTMKLRWLMAGTFEPKHAEFEWIMKQHEMKSKKKFFL